MKVGQSSSTGRSKSIGIINSMRENIEGEPNPTQVCLVFVRERVVERERRGVRGKHTVRKSRQVCKDTGMQCMCPHSCADL